MAVELSDLDVPDVVILRSFDVLNFNGQFLVLLKNRLRHAKGRSLVRVSPRGPRTLRLLITSGLSPANVKEGGTLHGCIKVERLTAC